MIDQSQILAGKSFAGGRKGAKQVVVRVVDEWMVVSRREGTRGFYRYSSMTSFLRWVNQQSKKVGS